MIASGNSKRMYDLISTTMNLEPSSIDSFYRLFLVPGMSHCIGGPGATNFGHWGAASVSAQSNDSAHNVLLALVDWVEQGNAPKFLVGTSDDGTVERVHCKYPAKSVWDRESGEWVCDSGTAQDTTPHDEL
jgi:feruloyl esterase